MSTSAVTSKPSAAKTAKEAAKKSVRIIKKYPNRRLYDTHGSHYITLEDVKYLAICNEEFQVVDAKTNEDITRSVLLQIITEEESCGSNMLSSGLLLQMIRAYGNATQDLMGNYLASGVDNFTKFNARLQEQLRTLYGEKPNLTRDLWAQFFNFQLHAMPNMMGAYFEQSKSVIAQMQNQINAQTNHILSAINISDSSHSEKKE